jgi:ankyrin repeat protein
VLPSDIREKSTLVKPLKPENLDKEREDDLLKVDLTPLQLSAVFGHSSSRRQLLDAGAKIPVHTEQWQNIEMIAIQQGHAAYLGGYLSQILGLQPRYLLESDFDDYAPAYGYNEVVGQRPGRDRKGRNAVMLAAKLGRVDCLEWLLSYKKVQTDTADMKGQTAVFHACKNGQNGSLQLLLYGLNDYSRGWRKPTVDPPASATGWTPLTTAVSNGHLACIKLLVHKHVDMDRATRSGDTALHCAINAPYHPEDTQIVELLLNSGADVNRKDDNGRTPLVLAVSKRNQSVAEVLLANGALTDLRDNDGRDACYIANSQRHSSLANVIEEYRTGKRRPGPI